MPWANQPSTTTDSLYDHVQLVGNFVFRAGRVPVSFCSKLQQHRQQSSAQTLKNTINRVRNIRQKNPKQYEKNRYPRSPGRNTIKQQNQTRQQYPNQKTKITWLDLPPPTNETQIIRSLRVCFRPVNAQMYTSVDSLVLARRGTNVSVDGWVMTRQGTYMSVDGLVLTGQGTNMTADGLILTRQGLLRPNILFLLFLIEIPWGYPWRGRQPTSLTKHRYWLLISPFYYWSARASDDRSVQLGRSSPSLHMTDEGVFIYGTAFTWRMEILESSRTALPNTQKSPCKNKTKNARKNTRGSEG